MLYPWVKAFHVISIIAWMAALLYLPRILVYHADAAPGSQQSETFKTMERRLLKGIAGPALLSSYVFGIWTAWLIRAWEDGWFWAKILGVLALTVFHAFLGEWVRGFAEDRNRRPARFYRAVNEIPTALMIGIVILVIVKPF
jgi:protoporphyrinogen IX oxidase